MNPSQPADEARGLATRPNEDLEALASVTDCALSTLDLEELMSVLLERLVHVMKADAGAILLDEGGGLVVRAMRGLSADAALLPPIPFGEGVGGRIAATGEPLYIADVATDPRVLGSFLKEQGIVSMLGVPLATRVQLVGILHVDWRTPHVESAIDLHLLETAAERCAMAIVNARLVEGLRAKNVQAELLLAREQEARLVAERAERQIVNILERVTDAFVALDTDWRYTYVSRKAAEIFGRRPEQLVGRHIWTEFPEGVGQPFYEAYHRAAAEQVPIQMEEHYPPYDRWFENRIYPSPDGLSIFFSDITERKRTDALLKSTNEQLRALSARLSSVREEEAVRISREIHDELGQLLTALRMDVGWVRTRLQRVVDSASPEGAALLARTDGMVDLTDRTIRSVQRISEELRPAALDQLGLEAAIEAQLQGLAERAGVTTRFSGALGDRRLGSDVETGVFRIVQELLTNVARHSGAHEVRVALTLEDGTLNVRVSDDGRGIRPSDLAAPRSLGLVGMRERALLMGGRVDLRAGAAGGTEALVTVPAGGATP